MRHVLLALTLPFLLLPYWCGRHANAHFDGDRDAWLPLADAVSHQLLTDPVVAHTGSARFDGEWTLGTCMMGTVGLAAVVKRFPDTEARYAPALEHCSRRLTSPEIGAFAERAWGHDAFSSLDDTRPRDAWLGYVLIALAAHEEARPGGGTAMLEPLAESLERRLRHPLHKLETYPNEGYPCDQAAMIGGVAWAARARGRPVPEAATQAARAFRAEAVDPESGWVWQARSIGTGSPHDAPRGSGTGLATFFLHPADEALSRDLYIANRDHGFRSLGFGAMREYAPGHSGYGDIDSGPVVFGVSVSATGFALGGARLHDDRSTYNRLFRTAWLFGVPVQTSNGRPYATGGTLGNAILLAMLTAGAT